MTFSRLSCTYLDWIYQEIDPIFVVYQHILKHFQKKYIKNIKISWFYIISSVKKSLKWGKYVNNLDNGIIYIFA